MALYRPDHKYIEAKKVVKELSDEGRDGLIKYYIRQLQDQIERSEKRNEEYQEVFDKMANFLPRRKEIY